MHDLGLVLHFENVKRYDYYVLDPYWITYGVYQILTSALAGDNNGMVEMEQLEYIVNEEADKKERYRPANYQKIEYSNMKCRFLLEILNEFKLSFRMPDDSKFIIPDLLDTDEPKAISEPIRKATESIRFVYEYEYLPKFIMPRIIVETHRIYSAIWRTGCVLQNNGCTALISAYSNRISIVVTGEHRRKYEFMSVIRFRIDDINRDLSDQPAMLIPLPGTSEFADYEELLERQKDGEKHYTVFRPVKKRFVISMLLEGVASRDELREISQKLDLLNTKADTIIDKLDVHFDYLMQLPVNQNLQAELTAALDELNAQQTAKITAEFTKQISTVIAQHHGKLDDKIQDIYDDLHLAENTGVKLKLAVPLLNLIGLELSTEFDVKKWAEQMYQKHRKQIFNIIVNARGRDIG